MQADSTGHYREVPLMQADSTGHYRGVAFIEGVSLYLGCKYVQKMMMTQVKGISLITLMIDNNPDSAAKLSILLFLLHFYVF
jgi:hypothetical protein